MSQSPVTNGPAIAAYIAGASQRVLPPEVADMARLCLADWLGVAIGVLIFAGLTAWDTQKIKEMYSVNDDGTIAGRKAVMGALTLYLDFINLFLFMLRFLGDRR